MDWTWQQRLRFFLVGCLWAAGGSLLPVGITLWDSIKNYTNPVDWVQMWRLTAACVGPAVLGYWLNHRSLLKLPPGLVLPPEFQPKMASKSVVVESHIAQMPSGEPVLEKQTTTVEKETQPMPTLEVKKGQ